MRLEDQRESENVEDRRGAGMGAGRGRLGIGGIVIALALGYFFGIDPSALMGMLDQGMPTAASVPAGKPPADDEMARFVSKVLSSTEDTWRDVFRQSGREYEDPKLVLFTGATPTACGTGQSAMGPFYCPGDRKVYIDLAFYRDLRERFEAPGEFAQAYVIAHEVGHHVQNLLGISEKVAAQRGRVAEVEYNKLSVRLELQADCLAGVWANHADRVRQVVEPGDIEEALNAASNIGDDRMQRRSQGHITPDSFTHGSSAQRVSWFQRGFQSGDINSCDTFQAKTL